MANQWITFGNLVDQNGADAKRKLLTTSEDVPYGVVLDLGAGKGNQIVSACQ